MSLTNGQVKFVDSNCLAYRVPPPAGHIREAETPDGIVLFDPRRGKQFPLDPVATCIWKSVKAGETVEQIVQKLAATCAVSHEQLLGDVVEFIESLEKERLLEEPVIAAMSPLKLWGIRLLNRLGFNHAAKQFRR